MKPAANQAPYRAPAAAPPPEGAHVAPLLAHADSCRREERWQEAAALYRAADGAMAPHATVKHNLALCLLATGDAAGALAHAEAALALDAALWQSAILRIKALKALARAEAALAAAQALLAREPANGDARLALADLLLHEIGDAHGAHRLAAPLREVPRHAADATLASLMARLYDRDNNHHNDSGEELTREIVAFAERHLALDAPHPNPLPASGAREFALGDRQRSSVISSDIPSPPNSERVRVRGLSADGQQQVSSITGLTPSPPEGERAGVRGQLPQTPYLARLSSHRRRIGLISPLFCTSPVYFFCIGALKLLAADFDLVFVHRGRTRDWATTEFRAIAHEWFDLAGLSSEALAQFLARQDFDVLVDLGGWMDSAALRALSAKPARRLYKWVGGQSATTGLKAFDGMLTDRWQTPRAQQPLYTEPLVLLRAGYVTYTAPAYLPAPAQAPRDAHALGVIANPAKVSRAFLAALAGKLADTGGTSSARRLKKPVVLRFVDRRYRHAAARARIATALAGAPAPIGERVAIEFVTPADHPAYLAEVGRLAAVIDTQPYSGGLTTVEALALGVPCWTRAGALFSERHSYAHCRYAGIELARCDFERGTLAAFAAAGQLAGGARRSLISSQSSRMDHAALAQELAALFTH